MQASLKDLIGRSIGMTNVKTDLIIYNTKADHVQITASTYLQIRFCIVLSATMCCYLLNGYIDLSADSVAFRLDCAN